MKRSLLLCLLLAAAPLTICAQGTAPAPLAGKVLITGSTTMAPLVAELAKRFSATRPGVAIRIEPGGSGRGVADVLEGKADIGMVSRDLRPPEKALFSIPITRDGVTFVVHKDNPVSGLTRAQAIAVFTGKIVNWKALGGRDARIDVVTRAAGGGTLDIVPPYLGIAPTAIRAAYVVEGEVPEAMRSIAANRNIIGFLSYGATEIAAKTGIPLKALALDGIAPDERAVRDGRWPMARSLNLVTRQVPAGVAKAFIEYALSPAVRNLIVEHDFVPYSN